MKKWLLLIFLSISFNIEADTVVLLHGLARTSKSMNKMEAALKKEGYKVVNIAYPSRKSSIEDLSKRIHQQILKEVKADETLYAVTHSMGGIIIRYIQSYYTLPHLKRVVMLSPPNHGSEVVDKLGDTFLFKELNGPAGQQLGTQEKSIFSKLKPIDFELGIMTGDRSINWFLSMMIPGSDDGKVSIESAKLEGMKAFKVVHATHPLIMKNKKVIQDVILFLREGYFSKDQ